MLSNGEVKTVAKWLGEGGKYEDEPTAFTFDLRFKNHFHDPIANEGFSGLGWTTILAGDSAIQWALADKETQSGGYYSWHDARAYYLKALTSGKKADRDKNFAETFRGVGQLMHLVQDMSVPEHARDDAHILRAYEAWLTEKDKNKDPNLDLKVAPVFFDKAELRKSNSLADVPVANLFDSGIYLGSNPDDTVIINGTGADATASPKNTIGLSEYTNANFVSVDTIFTGYDYPAENSTKIVEEDIDDPLNPGTLVKRQYYKKIKHGDRGYLLAGVGYLEVHDKSSSDSTSSMYLKPMDDYVFAGYAKKLIPRAIGYSASLLDYFFRGRIVLSRNPSGEGYLIENLSDEDMYGTFSLYYDNAEGDRFFLKEWTDIQISAFSHSNDFFFDKPSDGTGEYMLIFKGKLGNETAAIAAKKIALKEYVYFQAGDHVFIWDVQKNDYADITDSASGEKVQFPVHINNVVLSFLSSSTKISIPLVEEIMPQSDCPNDGSLFQSNETTATCSDGSIWTQSRIVTEVSNDATGIHPNFTETTTIYADYKYIPSWGYGTRHPWGRWPERSYDVRFPSSIYYTAPLVSQRLIE